MMKALTVISSVRCR